MQRGLILPPKAGLTTISGLGDSITRQDHGTYSGGNTFLDYAAALSAGRIIAIGNYGVPGQKATDMVARVQQAVQDRPTFVSVLAGTNDINQGVQAGWTTQQIVASAGAALASIYRAIRASGSIPIACTVPPYGYSTGLSDPRKIANEALNAWIRRYADVHGFPLADFYELLVDPGSINGTTSSAAGNWKNPPLTYTTDGIHPKPIAAGMMGQLLVNTIANAFPAGYTSMPQSTLVDSAQTFSMLKNPLWKTQTTNPNVYPDNANTLGAAISNATGVTYSMAVDAALPGFYLNIALAGSATTAGGIAPQTGTETVAAGDVVQFSGVFECDGNIGVTAQVVLGGQTFKALNILAGTAITKGRYFMEFVAPATGIPAVQLVTTTPSSSPASNTKFWQPRIVNATKWFGATAPITRD